MGLTALLAVAVGLAPLATMARIGLVTFIVCTGLMFALGGSNHWTWVLKVASGKWLELKQGLLGLNQWRES